MDKKYFYQRLFAVAAVSGVLTLAGTSALAVRKQHDADRKTGKTIVKADKPIGKFGPGIGLPGTFSSSSEISTRTLGGARSFDVDKGGNALLRSVPQRVLPTAPLRACVTYDLDRTSYGMVDVTSEGLVVLREHEGLQAAWGGAGVGTKYYFNTCADVTGGYVQDVETYLWDTSTWTCIGYDQMPSFDVLSYSMTCDPVTEIIYGCFFSADLQTIEIGTLDPMSMKRTGVIGTVETPLYAMGFSSDGTLYGIDKAGALYIVSLTDAHYTKVAETGITTDYNTTGTVDSFNDVFYYAACPSGPSDDPSKDWALYSIDIANDFKVSKCWDLRAELGGMYIANAAARPYAPAEPRLNEVAFTNGSLEGTVSFTAPKRTFNGNDLVGALEYGILANDKVIATGNVNASEDKTVGITLPEAGMYTIRVFVSNGEGTSPKSESETRWIGNGCPLTPEGLTAVYTYGGTAVNVNWAPVSSSLNDGFMRPEDVTYTVSRSLDGADFEVVADKIGDPAFTDEVGPQTVCHIYRYKVVANHEEQTSAPAFSDYVAVGTLETPFAPDFLEPLTEGYFTTRDYLGRGHKWTYSSYDEAMMMLWNAGWNMTDMDASLVTAPIRLEGGKAYEISYNAWVESNGTFGIGLQWGADMSSPETIIEPVSISAANSSYLVPLHQSVILFPERDGVYYFGVRTLANPTQSVKILVNDFKVSQGLSAKAPGEVTDVTINPQYDGSKKLDISFNAPTVTIEGKKLSNLSKIEVRRDGNLVKTFRNPTFGQNLSFLDEGDKNEDVAYTITAYSIDGPGKSWYGTSHMGVNLPASPVDCQITQNLENPGEVTVTWTPVARDINGIEIDPSLIRYAIFASDYETMIVNNLTAAFPSATFRAIPPESGQAFVWYCVVPYTEGGVNGYVGGFGVTPMIPVGTPFTLPYFESFGGSGLAYPMGMSGDGSVRLSQSISSQGLTIASQDDDNGLLVWYTAPETTLDLYSAVIKVDDTDDVAMSFYYAGVPEVEGYTIEPLVIYDGASEPLCPAIDTKDCAEKGWNRVQASLVPWRGKYVQFAFHVVCNDNGFGFGLDNVVLKRYAANDLRAGSVSAPSFLTVGKDHEIIAEIINDGSDDAAAGYQVDLYADGKLVATSDGPAVRSFESDVVSFKFMPDPFAEEEQMFRTEIRWSLDEILANNISEEIVVPLVETVYPAVTDLTASLDDDTDSADIAWTEPDHEAKLQEITESFETYDPFTLAGFGNWKVFDGDGLQTWYLGRPVYIAGVGNGPSYPNGTTPKAWMVTDQTQMKIDYSGARTGDRAALASSVSGEADDWLISPELPGIAQTVSFWAATAPEDCGEESFEFYYSTGGTDPEDFIKLGDTVDVPEGEWELDEYDDEYQVTTWYNYSYELPEGAKYFAIRYVSDDIYGLFVDDITFTVSDEVLTLQGYNLFRNGAKLNEELLTATSYKDDMSILDDGEYTYAVETVYDKGHSGLSNRETVTVDHPISVDAILAEGVTVFTEKGFIIVTGAAGKQIGISTPAGLNVYNAVPDADIRVAVEPGIYLVRLGKRTVKVIVR